MISESNQVTDAFGGAVQIKEKGDFTILGIPFDEKSSNRSGAAGGPGAIRAMSSGRSMNSFTESNVDLSADTVIVDRGDMSITSDSEILFKGIEDAISAIAREGSIPVTLGGDHSITYPVVKGIRQIHNEINLLWLDAHPDIYSDYLGDRLSHACPLARIMEHGGVKNIYQGGIRATNRKLNESLAAAGVNVFNVGEFHKLKGLRLEGKTYVTIDIDVLDPAFAPGVGNPVPGGVSTRELIEVILSLDTEIIGFDVVEVNPDYDVSGITAAAGAKIVMELIGRIVLLKG